MSEFAAEAADTHAPSSGAQTAADAAELRASLTDLAGLVCQSSGLQSVLGQVAAFAVRAVPGAEGAGVTLLQLDGAEDSEITIEALSASHPFVCEIDLIQHDTAKEGPCITAALRRRTVSSGSLGEEQMWPRFGPRASRLGVHSALSLPLLLPRRVVGALNVYAHAKDVFDDHAAHLGELFAAPAAVALHNAQLLAHAEALSARLQSAISSRAIIDQAIGLLRGRTGATAQEALTSLRGISHRDHVTLSVVAQHVVDDAIRRAHTRHTQQ
jgi:GAF domain-containing protein